MKPLKVLLVDTTQYQPSSPLFAEALERATRAGIVEGLFIDEAATFARLSNSVGERFVRKIRPWPHKSVREFHAAVVARAKRFAADVVLVVKGAHLTVECVAGLKDIGATLVNFATDDPFNPRTSTADWLQTLPLYDIVCTPRRANILDLQGLGVRRVHFVPFGYKPEVHWPELPQDATESGRFQSDVCFIGGADDDRVPYFEELIDRMPAVKLALYGGYWNRSRHLARFWRGYAVGREFRLAVSGAAVSINLVRRANRDDHVMRSFEVPACGGCMLTEPTATHRELFGGEDDAWFFDSPSELIDKARTLLTRPALRTQLALAGRQRIVGAANRYDDRLLTILQLVDHERPASDHSTHLASA